MTQNPIWPGLELKDYLANNMTQYLSVHFRKTTNKASRHAHFIIGFRTLPIEVSVVPPVKHGSCLPFIAGFGFQV